MLVILEFVEKVEVRGSPASLFSISSHFFNQPNACYSKGRCLLVERRRVKGEVGGLVESDENRIEHISISVNTFLTLSNQLDACY